ncbi:Aste57867_25143 [Aphanomyces stellatus]|uniref:Aste57867_25143 protein n=1 Tax=Aphanomyces stellatus TaxID=120398 RepID=A0A485LWW1_9STRA|nr:hypothetical protein As57867_025065 [Aphanomyces stellatus]VFU01772.1 Aste57867_25143 [Aphanomyces stellatus]
MSGGHLKSRDCRVGLVDQRLHFSIEMTPSTAETCYLCADVTHEPTDAMELIAPCACRSYIHRSCLDDWRRTSIAAKSNCPTCTQPYEMEEAETMPTNVVEVAWDVLLGCWFNIFTCVWSVGLMVAAVLVGPFVGMLAVTSVSMKIYNSVLHHQFGLEPNAGQYISQQQRRHLPRVRNLRPIESIPTQLDC